MVPFSVLPVLNIEQRLRTVLDSFRDDNKSAVFFEACEKAPLARSVIASWHLQANKNPFLKLLAVTRVVVDERKSCVNSVLTFVEKNRTVLETYSFVSERNNLLKHTL